MEIKKLQEENSRLQGDINELKRDKGETTRNHNDKIVSMQERHNQEIQNQQRNFEKMFEEKETKIKELQNENERLKLELGVTDKSKDGQDTKKLLNELFELRNIVQKYENEKLIYLDDIEKLKYNLAESAKQVLKEMIRKYC